MKKYLKIALVLFLIIISYFFYSRFKSISEIPSFEYNTLDNEIYSNKSIEKSNKRTVFVYFSCKCDDCKELINDIENYKKILHNNKIILITTEKNKDVIENFVNYEKIKQLNIPLLIDGKNNFPSDFSLGISIDLPKIIVFDENGILINDIKSLDNPKLLDYK